MVETIIRTVPFAQIIETGSYRGSTAEYFASFHLPVTTVEITPRFYWYARWRLRDRPNVCIVLGDSAAVLRSLSSDNGAAGTAFFYLDAHWNEHLPLKEELDAIVLGWDRWVAVIDDFQVPDDPGYGFDDYGAGKRLTIEILALERRPDVHAFWPAVASGAESGARRGCIILASGSLAPALDAMPLLRRAAE